MKSVACYFRRLLAAAVAISLLAATSAHAAFHYWYISEVYTDASGTRQFIEFNTPFGSQQYVGGQQVQVNNVGNTETHTFTIPNSLPGDSGGHAFLMATAAAQSAGAPPADFTIPNNFLFPEGGSISFFGQNSGAYAALPTDGVLSRTWSGGNATNTPQNFSGQNGFVTNPPSPPSITITNPPDGNSFLAPATVTVGVAAADNDGTVASVRLLTNGVPAATNTVAPFGFTLTSLPVGDYTLRAVAQDNSSLSTTSAPVVIHVTNLPLLQAALGDNGLIKFSFPSALGVNYVIERATPLTNFSPVVTNPGTGGTITFQETDGSAVQRSYRVRLE